ncbi:3-(3-hydroxy-phenyl)propionate transporter MhpT [Roseiterribacter gracilis]|uniref:4-hydroxybenzoate transporter n=1 Tax=Roseiterribacter gracilis TaxID=2812848 RepID=A0A8S8XLA8_9PROT|nr:4-hydroxybenzoate transporter [Rhodospirillales bacterium TMPK1]
MRATIALCFIVAMIEGFDLQAAGVAAPLLGPAFGLAPEQMGLFFSAATLGLMLGALIGGRIADRLGRKFGLIVALVLFGVCSIATAFAWDFTSLFVARLLTGVGLGGALPSLIAVAAESSRPGKTGFAVAAMYAGIPTGGGVAALLSVLGLHGGWSTIFLIGGAAPLLVAPLLLRFLPNTMQPRTESAASNRARALAALFSAGTWRTTASLWAGFFFSLLVLYLLLNWLPALLVARGVDRTQAGMVQIAFNLAGALGGLTAGRAMDLFRQRVVVVTAFGGLIASLAILAASPPVFLYVAIAGGLVGTAIVAVQAILYGLAPLQYPIDVRGTGVGAAVAVGRLGSVVGPLLAGTLVAAGRSSAEVLLGIVPIAALGAIATFLLVKRR